MNRLQRCGNCAGCTAQACGVCVFCKDSTHFGGPGLKKQSCVYRRCVKVLEYRLSKEISPQRTKGGCGHCNGCQASDCGLCLVCMDKLFFAEKYLPGALCFKKKCRNPRVLNLKPVDVPPYDGAPLVPTVSRKKSVKTPKPPGFSRKKPRDVENFADDADDKPKKVKKLKKFKPVDPNLDDKRDQRSETAKTSILMPKITSKSSNLPKTPKIFTSHPQNAIERAFLSIMQQNTKFHDYSDDNQVMGDAINAKTTLPILPNLPKPEETASSAFPQSTVTSVGAADSYSLYKTLPKATIVSSSSAAAAYDWPPPKVLYPTSVEPIILLQQVVIQPNGDISVLPQTNPASSDVSGVIVSLDSDQLISYCNNLSAPSATPPNTPQQLKNSIQGNSPLVPSSPSLPAEPAVRVYQQMPTPKHFIRIGSSPSGGLHQSE